MKCRSIVISALAAIAAAQTENEPQTCTIQFFYNTGQYNSYSVPVLKCNIPSLLPKECAERGNALAAIYKAGAVTTQDPPSYSPYYEVYPEVDLTQLHVFTEMPTICGIFGGQVGMPEKL